MNWSYKKVAKAAKMFRGNGYDFNSRLQTRDSRLRSSRPYRLLIAATLLLFISTRSAYSADAQRLEKLVIGYPAPVASLGIIDVMRKAGLFRKNGLDVDLVYIQGSPILTTAMVSGQVPLSFIGGAAIVASAVGGADTVYLACVINTLYWRCFSVSVC